MGRFKHIEVVKKYAEYYNNEHPNLKLSAEDWRSLLKIRLFN